MALAYLRFLRRIPEPNLGKLEIDRNKNGIGDPGSKQMVYGKKKDAALYNIWRENFGFGIQKRWIKMVGFCPKVVKFNF